MKMSTLLQTGVYIHQFLYMHIYIYKKIFLLFLHLRVLLASAWKYYLKPATYNVLNKREDAPEPSNPNWYIHSDDSHISIYTDKGEIILCLISSVSILIKWQCICISVITFSVFDCWVVPRSGNGSFTFNKFHWINRQLLRDAAVLEKGSNGPKASAQFGCMSECIVHLIVVYETKMDWQNNKLSINLSWSWVWVFMDSYFWLQVLLYFEP